MNIVHRIDKTLDELFSMVDRVLIDRTRCENEIQMGSDSRDRGLCNRPAFVTDLIDERQKCLRCFTESFQQ